MTTLKEYSITMGDFTKYKSSQKLQELAKYPYDLTVEGNLNPERIEKYCSEGCGYKFLYATERVNDEVMHSLIELAEEAHAIDKMEKMQRGEIVNYIEGFPSENRQSQHTAVRDFFGSPLSDPNNIEKAKKETDKLQHFLENQKHFTDLIMVAIGGSDLGPQAHYFGLKHLQKPGRNVHFISNVDPDATSMAMEGLDLSKCMVVVVSKSGTTLETVTNELQVRARFEKAGLDPKNHFVAVTSEGSPMDDKTKYLESFHMWDWIGGRYSTTSMAGGVMLSFAFGFDVYWEFLRGCNAMDRIALERDINKNLPLLSALLSIWNHNFLSYPTLALIPYSQPLARYAAHIQQVEMESNGKYINRKGEHVNFQTCPIIWGEPGTNAQHSFYQLIHQGTQTVAMELIGFKENQYGNDLNVNGTNSQQKLLSNLLAQAISLATGQKNDNPNKFFPGNRPSHILLGKKLTPFSLGALLAYFEHKVVFQGFIWGINSFDQEGVQLGKVTANKIIDRFASRGDAYPIGDAFLKHLKTL